MKLLFIFAIFLTLFCHCQAKPETTKEQLYETADAPPPPPEPELYDQEVKYDQEEQSELKSSHPNTQGEVAISTARFTPPTLLPEKVIRHAYLRLQVKDYVASTKLLKESILKRQAFITHSEEERNKGTLENSLKIRVTPENFDYLIEDLQQESVYLEQKTITAKDVTEESIDVESRLKSKKKVAERYLALLACARNVREILAIETELKSIQEEIEATTARLQYLQNQVAYCTITLDYFQTTPPALSPDNSISKRISQALLIGWESAVAAFILLVRLWPAAVFISLLVYFYYKTRKTRITSISAPPV